jgi:polar amino acid transport system substrate-binding protein
MFGMMTTIHRAYCLAITLLWIALALPVLAQESAESLQHFRHVDSAATPPAEAVTGELKLLADQDFAPFSFRDANGAMAGISIDMALAACTELRIKCQIVPLPFTDLLPTLIRGEGDAIITGLRLTRAMMKQATMTRPYFFSSGRFITRTGTPFESPDVRSLAGRRVGYVKSTSHGTFLEKYYERSALTPFSDETAMFEALRTGGLDAVFTDSMRAAFWLKGSASRNCCVPLGASFRDRDTFSRGLSFLIKRDKDQVREAFDFALDRLEANGSAAKIFAHYAPPSAF